MLFEDVEKLQSSSGQVGAMFKMSVCLRSFANMIKVLFIGNLINWSKRRHTMHSCRGRRLQCLAQWHNDSATGGAWVVFAVGTRIQLTSNWTLAFQCSEKLAFVWRFPHICPSLVTHWCCTVYHKQVKILIWAAVIWKS